MRGTYASDGGQLWVETAPFAAFASAAAWPVANTATLTKVRTAKPITVSSVTIFIGAAAGNVDVGIYSLTGSTWNRLASSGSTAAAGTNAVQTINLTAPIALSPHVDYWIAVVADTTTTLTIGRLAPPAALGGFGNGNVSKASSFPLPSQITTPAATSYTPWARLG